jgi:hypothetical protein
MVRSEKSTATGFLIKPKLNLKENSGLVKNLDPPAFTANLWEKGRTVLSHHLNLGFYLKAAG